MQFNLLELLLCTTIFLLTALAQSRSPAEYWTRELNKYFQEKRTEFCPNCLGVCLSPEKPVPGESSLARDIRIDVVKLNPPPDHADSRIRANTLSFSTEKRSWPKDKKLCSSKCAHELWTTLDQFVSIQISLVKEGRTEWAGLTRAQAVRVLRLAWYSAENIECYDSDRLEPGRNPQVPQTPRKVRPQGKSLGRKR